MALVVTHRRPETQIQPMGMEDSLEEGMAAHDSTLVLRINGYRILMGYSLRVLHRVKHN